MCASPMWPTWPIIDNAEDSYTRLNGERFVVLKIYKDATSSAR